MGLRQANVNYAAKGWRIIFQLKFLRRGFPEINPGPWAMLRRPKTRASSSDAPTI